MTTAVFPSDLPDLAVISARLGRDPLLIQAAGGNTSVKDGNVMWIKASGTVLSQALEQDIFVPVDLPAMRIAIGNTMPDADKPAAFALGDSGLRPSIETCLHALFAQRIVLHVHCVNTISIAIRSDAEQILEERLQDFDWCLAPYEKPGAALATEVMKRLTATTDVVVLGNHGLLVAAHTPKEAEALLQRVVAALAMPIDETAPPNLDLLRTYSAAWEVPDSAHPVHQLALDARRVEQVTHGSLYPDHVIFCGPGVSSTTQPGQPDETSPPFVIVPGAGALFNPDAGESARALARCLGDVMMRVPPDATLTYLTPEDDADLLNWDAEKYRQSLNAR